VEECTTRKEGLEKALTINNSVWVSASAGSGKTTLLAKRLLALLLGNVDVAKIICITYTKTGANEIKKKIYESISRWATANEDELRREIQEIIGLHNVTMEYLRQARTLFVKVIDNIDNLKIFTIHSFCQQIISRFPLEAGILPNFEVIDDSKSNELSEQSVENLLLNITENSDIYDDLKLLILEQNEEDFYKMINYLISKRKEFEVLQNYDYKSDLRSKFNISTTDKNDIEKVFLDHDYTNVLNLFGEISEGNFTEKQKADFSYLKTFVDYKSTENIENYLNVFLTKNHSKRKFSGGIFKRLGEHFIDIVELEQERCYNFAQEMENIKYYTLTLAMINVALKIIDNYRKLKSGRGFLDFDDLIIVTLNLLQNTEYSAWINYKLDNGIEHILVDEAQDTSTLQWQIIDNLTGDFFVGSTKNESSRTLFVVGDEKQSIFKFQGANPQMFNEKYKFYEELIRNSRNNFFRVSLQRSFRSLGTILTFVDAVFRDKEYADKISKLSNKIVHENTRQGVGLVELWPVVEVEKSNNNGWIIDFDSKEEVKKQEILAKNIARKIKSLISGDRVIIGKNGKKRRIKCGDIMVLVKKRNPIFLSYLMKYLNKSSIANSGYDRLNLFDDVVIQDFISLFKFILFRNDDLSLANLVKSPILGLREEDLYVLCGEKNDKNTTLFEAMKANKKYQEQYLLLCSIIEKSKILNIHSLYFYILEECNIRRKILERFSADVNGILNRFSDFIWEYEKNNICSLLSFLFFVENNKNNIKKDLDSDNMEQVRIMTVHASKGMQAPIVFIADATVGIGGSKEKILWSEGEFGYNLPLYKVKSNSDVVEMAKNSSNLDLHSEYFRLFYVAMTRAENELYICGWSNENSGENEEKKKEEKNTWFDLAKGTMLYLGAREEKFEFAENTRKFVFGEALSEKIEEESEKNSAKMLDNSHILRNIVRYEGGDMEKKVITPSQFFSHVDRDNLFAKINYPVLRGNAIHKLLEVLPNSRPEDRNSVADIYLNNLFSALSDGDKIDIKNKVTDILTDKKFEKFFGENSRSEVEIVGELDNFMISGKIDRLAEHEDKILLLDYKNTAKHYKTKEELPEAYLKQMEMYSRLVQQIYGEKDVEMYILVTTYLEIIKV
jgi:ATP-dependent helicase/nuclease subunit A